MFPPTKVKRRENVGVAGKKQLIGGTTGDERDDRRRLEKRPGKSTNFLVF